MVRGGVGARSCPPPPPCKISRLCGAIVSLALGVPTLKKTTLLILRRCFQHYIYISLLAFIKTLKTVEGCISTKAMNNSGYMIF